MTCPRCNGTGSYMYDHNHGKPCEVCCPHDEGRWLLNNEGYGTGQGKWACKRGCGTLWESEDVAEPWPGPTKEEREAYRRKLFDAVYPIDGEASAEEMAQLMTSEGETP